MKNCFKNGAISAEFVGESVAKHQTKKNIGAHEIFLGQVREDLIDGKLVCAIEYEAHEEMANAEFERIREEAFEKFDLSCLHIYHSIGLVKTGEICLFVFASSAHRLEARKGLEFLVEEIKQHVPIFAREIFSDDTHVWKVNK